jgi:hypothetical protein
MSKSFKLSKEHEKFCSLMKCPLCNRFPIIPNYFQGNGRQISRNVAIADMDISAIAECPKCKQRWVVFATSQSRSSTPLSQSGIDSEKVHSEETPEVSKFQLIETDRSEEALGSDRRTIDNSKGTGRVTRKLTVSKEWSKTYTVDFEKAVKTQGEASFDLLKLINLKANLEGELRKKYSVSESIKNIYTDEVSVEIEPRTKVLYVFSWKCIWQNGIVKCLDSGNKEIASIPFQIAIGVTFDIASE